MWLFHPTQAEGVLCQTAAQRRTLSAVKALISGAFLRVKRVRANYLTSAFPKFLEDHGLRRMRFHDLRHSCASLLLANGVPLKHGMACTKALASLVWMPRFSNSVAMMPMMYTPQPVMGTRMHTGEEVESRM